MTISYPSRSCPGGPEYKLLPLVLWARAKNLTRQVAGLPIFDGRSFLRTLAHPNEAATEVFLRIAEDRRHAVAETFAIAGRCRQRVSCWQVLYRGFTSTKMIAPDLGQFDVTDGTLGA